MSLPTLAAPANDAQPRQQPRPPASKMWIPSPTVFPGDTFPSEAVTGAFVSSAERRAVSENMDFKYHKWHLKYAPNGKEWAPSAAMDAYLDGLLADCGSIYDATQRRWDLGADSVKGVGRVRAFRWLLDRLLGLFDSGGMFLATQELASVRSFTSLNKSAPVLALCRDPVGSPCLMPAGYSTCVVPIEVAGTMRESCADMIRNQLLVYARRCMTRCPERHSITCMVFCDNKLYIYVFDHNGYHVTRSIKIHEEPKLLIYALYCLSQERPVDTIGWHEGVYCLQIPDYRSPNTIHHFRIDGLVHVDPHIHGCARAAWRVTGCNGERLLVKRTWDVKESEESIEEPEATMMIKAGNVPGITRLALYSQETTGYTSDAPHSRRDPADFGELYKREQLARRHRILVVEYFERDIMQVRSNEELLLVLRDAVQAHGELWKIGICHRDICTKNIRIKEGGRSSGVLVGLDKAKPVTEQSAVVPCMPDVANKNMFQSRYVLRIAAEPKSKEVYPSLWDDLESFFYVLCFICSTDSKGIRDMFSDWASENPEVSLEAKSTFCVACQPSLSWNLFVDPYFGPVFMKLLAGMHRSLHSYDEDRSRGHETFLALIDAAIIELSKTPELPAVDVS